MKGAGAGVDNDWNLASISWYKVCETCILTITFLSGSNLVVLALSKRLICDTPLACL